MSSENPENLVIASEPPGSDVPAATTTADSSLATPPPPAAATAAEGMHSVELSAEDIVAMDICTTAGRIVVDSHDQPRIIVYVMNHDPALSQLDVAVKGDTIHIEIKHLVNPRWLWSRRKTCATSLRVMCPRGLLVSARSGSGDIRIIGATEDVDVETQSGNVVLEGLTGNVAVRAGTGSVTGDAPCESLEIATESGDTKVSGLAGSLAYKSSSGELRAAWSRVPVAGKVDIKTGKGSVSLQMPADTRLNYRFITGPTPIMNEFEHDPLAAFRLNIVARSGGLSVRKAR